VPLPVDPRVVVVRDEGEGEARILGLLGERHQVERGMLLAGQRVPDLDHQPPLGAQRASKNQIRMTIPGTPRSHASRNLMFPTSFRGPGPTPTVSVVVQLVLVIVEIVVLFLVFYALIVRWLVCTAGGGLLFTSAARLATRRELPFESLHHGSFPGVVT
jgi:hypothetical protein